jgi:hypothetical protein
MKTKQLLASSADLLLTSLLGASSLAEYRGFHLDGGLGSVARHAGEDPKDADVHHTRPALIH